MPDATLDESTPSWLQELANDSLYMEEPIKEDQNDTAVPSALKLAKVPDPETGSVLLNSAPAETKLIEEELTAD